MSGRALLLVLAGTIGCVPVHRRAATSDTVLGETSVHGDVAGVTWAGSSRATERGFDIQVVGENECRREIERRGTRTTRIEKRADRFVLGGSIVAGVVLGAIGGAFLYDSRDGAIPEDALLYGGDPAVGRSTGIALAAVGGVALLTAAVGGLRARDEIGDSTPFTMRVAGEGTVGCGQAAAWGVQISLVHGDTELLVGTTNGDGRLDVPYAALPEQLFTASAEAVQVKALKDDRAFVIGEISLATARQTWLAARWRDVESTTDPARLEAHAAHDPTRAADAMQRARTMRLARATSALTSNDASAAAAELAVLKAKHAAGSDLDALARQLGELQATLAADERERNRASTLQNVETAVTVARTTTASADAFQAATTQLEQARAAYANEPRLVELSASLEKARKQRVSALLAEVQRHARSSNFAAARQGVTEAGRIAPQDARVGREAKAIDDRELQVIEREAKAALAGRRLDAAMAAVERGIAIREDDPRMLRLFKQIYKAGRNARAKDEAARERSEAKDLKARLAAARQLSRKGEFSAARRAVEDARIAHGDGAALTAAKTAIDKAELDALIGSANKALAAKRLDDAAAAVDRGMRLDADDPRLTRLIEKIRKRRGE